MNSAAKISSQKGLRKLIGQTTRKHRQLYKCKQGESGDIQYQTCETYMEGYQQAQNDGL
jgi:predicted Mrr-cat superfamily restriction endonuclease